MKTIPNVLHSATVGAVRLFVPAMLAMTAAGVAPSALAEPAKESTPYTLFMGVDLELQRNKDYHRVHDVIGGSFLIRANGEEIRVPVNSESTNIRVTQSLKLAAGSGKVANLKAERAYTPANDPRKKWMASASSYDMGNETRNMVAAEVGVNAANALENSGSRMPAEVIGQIKAEAAGRLSDASRSFDSGIRQGQSDQFNAGYNAAKMEEELAREQYDAIDVLFEISSDKPVNNPYVLLIAQYHEPGSKPGMVRNWIHAEALDPLGEKPQKVRVKYGGFPPGYTLEQCQVHLYDGGRELATTVAPKRVPLTRDEAFTYLLMDYLGSHKKDDLPAAPAIGKPAGEARARLSPDQWRETYFVRVSKDGLPVAAFFDPTCSRPVDEMIAALVTDIRFYPALAKGKAVEGVAELRFPRLSL